MLPGAGARLKLKEGAWGPEGVVGAASESKKEKEHLEQDMGAASESKTQKE